ncbi:MFS transporter [Hyphomicrobium sp. CS1GBMeth3]|uniref:MFS transporter n=1 Tax=Hyphomicrobium sp. CS1GBMeth3 TaxID=1892845 RepID=UPI000930CD51|nr:MFS transporter [Hyphomicrobium sp. CS1GBMeth3]
MRLDQVIAVERRDAESKPQALWHLALISLIAFLTVVDLFAAQALLPTLVAHYGVSPAAMGLAVNACTLGMAVGGLGIAFGGYRVPRRGGIVLSLSLLALPTLLLSAAPNLIVFSLLRIAQGLFMSAAFGLTLAYLGERYMAERSASVFAAYITGNVASNLVGRLIATAVADYAGLSAAFAVFALLNLSGAALVYCTIENIPRGHGMMTRATWSSAIDHLFDPTLRAGFVVGFCILFAFIGTFTYINFELVKPPLALGMMELGIIYLVFLPSIVSTPFAGRAVSAFGVQPSLWVALAIAALGLPMLLSGNLPTVVSGMALVGVGTFFAQAIATGFVSRAARHNRSAASGIYLTSYFLGGLVGSAILGALYVRLGWLGCVAGIGVALAAAALFTAKLRLG